MWDVALEIDPVTGLLAYDEVLLIGPRQVTGKTEWLLPLATHRCVGGFAAQGAQRVLWTAQTADDARLRWRDIHLKRLQAVPKLKRQFRPRLTQNKEAFLWRNGSIWAPGSTTGKKGGTGDTLDLGIIDEAWSKEDSKTELSMRPTMMTRDSAQLIVASMIPGISRKQPGTWPYLRNKRQVGRARVEAGVRRGMCVFDYAAPPGADSGDPATWWMCMPGLGYTVTEAKVQSDYDAALARENGLVDFCAEYLSWEPESGVTRWGVIRKETWERRENPGSSIVDAPAIALEIDDDRAHAVICASGWNAVGAKHIEVVEPGHKVPAAVASRDGRPAGTDWLLPRALEIIEEQGPCTVVIDPRRQAGSLIVPLQNRGIDVLTPNTLAVGGAHGRFYDLTGEEARADDDGMRLAHIGQTELTRAMQQAVKLDLGSGAFTFVKRGTASVLINIYGCVLAMHGHDVFSANNYDVLDSVDSGRPCRCGRSLYVDDGVWLHAGDDSRECGT